MKPIVSVHACVHLRILLILFLLALVAIKVALILAQGPVPIERDALGYWRLSTVAMQGDPLMFEAAIAYRTPGYPWLLAIVRALAGRQALFAVACLQGILSFASICIAGHIAGRITKLPKATLWTLLVSLPMVSAYTYNAAVLSEPLFVFLLMLHLLAVLNYAKYDSSDRAVWVGITFAVTLLVRPIVLLLWVPHLIFLLFIHYRRRRRLGSHALRRARLHHRLIHAAYAGFTVALLCTPWLLRNQAIFGDPFLTEFVGRNLWVVTFQDGSGTGLDLPSSPSAETLVKRLAAVETGDSWRATWAVSEALVRSGLNDAQADRLMKHVCLDAIQSSDANRKQFAYKAFRRICNFWRCAATELPQQDPQATALGGQRSWHRDTGPASAAITWMRNHRWSNSVALNTALAVALGIASVVLLLHYPSRPYALWIILCLAYFAVITGSLEIPAYRYRMVVEPMVALVFGSAIAVISSQRRRPARVVT